jgi:hypothetical protein
MKLVVGDGFQGDLTSDDYERRSATTFSALKKIETIP